MIQYGTWSIPRPVASLVMAAAIVLSIRHVPPLLEAARFPSVWPGHSRQGEAPALCGKALHSAAEGSTKDFKEDPKDRGSSPACAPTKRLPTPDYVLPLSVWPWRSQHGQDRILFHEFFHDDALGAVLNGVFVEIGALDGLLDSSTFAYERQLGWHGMLVEGCPGHWEKLNHNRPSESTQKVHMMVCASNGTVQHPAHCSARSGVPGDNRASQDGAAVTVPCSRMGAILKQHGIDHIDLFRVDVAGSELQLLQTMDWDIPVDIMVVAIQHQPYEVIHAIRKLLRGNGYVSRGLCCRNYADEIFQNLNYPHQQFPRKYTPVPPPPPRTNADERLKPCTAVSAQMAQVLGDNQKTGRNAAGFVKYVHEVASDCSTT
uniref:Methyltransferase FkbM domain-containing protein n=1 Tax=Eutreptiella gymnastica TaxID=73025 RepID=A0A7S1J8S4_9EUGL|mmetsp:Transcript_76560/g.135188  ORF Transcript_76560/g.135188 Transcript_76560/m.135188 type:complete len:374 (+) Transcript_76560:70-1191(+)